ncbi:hypothetical protein SASPL_140177 [Salvia splendens]|uniref:Uncharacterized protein n=1 Tax=Salvia splendens TaxID=180675 RepID=A0A8X8WRI1_SALSN|nr:hypothetical protein SASPL_140177 [Salvia splendens]
MSFYRTPKAPAAATVKPRPAAAVLVKTTSLRCDVGKSGDGYVHGPDGGGGDQCVDRKASSYISQVKERRRLEESTLLVDDLDEL